MLLNTEMQPILLYKQNICLVWVLLLRSKGKQLLYQLFSSSEISLLKFHFRNVSAAAVKMDLKFPL